MKMMSIFTVVFCATFLTFAAISLLIVQSSVQETAIKRIPVEPPDTNSSAIVTHMKYNKYYVEKNKIKSIKLN